MQFTPRNHRRRRRNPDIEAVLAVPAFRHGDPRRLAELARHTDRLRLAPGRTLARAGGTARELVVIVSGRAAVLREGAMTAALQAGDQIGGDEVIRSERHTATIVTTSEVEVVVVNGPAVVWAHQEGLVSRFEAPVALTGVPAARRPGVDPPARLAS
ncbi:MAG TPA: cyclic nucleotide-binding domain-containing protein [Acidimicrobiales bacterium]|nr:cyclic nucleotide-binding domain-containing protein [Acidimicrobiales bacterium]